MSRRDVLAAVVLLLAAWAEQLSGGREQLEVHLALAAALALPIAVARRWPWLPAGTAALVLVAYGARGEEPDATAEIVALAGIAVLSGSRMAQAGALRALAVLVCGATVSLALDGALQDVVWVCGIFLAPPWLFGRSLRARRLRIGELETLNARLAEERRRVAVLAAEAERAVIGHDIELVLLESLRDMVASAEAGESLVATAPESAAATFEDIRARGAEATAELRRLLRLLHA